MASRIIVLGLQDPPLREGASVLDTCCPKARLRVALLWPNAGLQALFGRLAAVWSLRVTPPQAAFVLGSKASVYWHVPVAQVSPLLPCLF